MTTQPETNGPLIGVRILDLAIGRFAAVGRQLAELGADVLRIEPSGGGGDRTGGVLATGVNMEFFVFNLGKQAIACDLAGPEFETLLGAADILVVTADSELDATETHRRHPGLVILAVSNFGAGNAYSSWQATTPVFHALSGELSRSGIPGRSPLLPPGDLAIDVAAAQAAFVILAAYLNRLKTGRGDLLDFSILDAATHALDPGYGIAGSATAGVPASKLPRGRAEARQQYPIIPCKDGFVRLCVLAPRQWQGMFAWLGRPQEFSDPAYSSLQRRFTSPTLIPAIARFFADKTRAELEKDGQAHGVPITAVFDLAETLQCEQILVRRALRPMEIAPGLRALILDGVLEIDGDRAGPRGPAPDLNANRDAIIAGWARPKVLPIWDLSGDRPLSGVRVLDLGVIVVGAEQGRLLADLGAEVIKVEHEGFPDGSRQTLDGSVMSVSFAAGNRNKQGLALNLRDPEGKALFLRLVTQSDIVLSNFKPGTLEALGLGYEALSQVNPRIIMADSSAFGATGPLSKSLGYGPLVRAFAGLTAQWRYPGEMESFSDAMTVYPDHVAARVCVIGVLALLLRRLRKKRGGTVSVAQAEVMLSHMALQVATSTLGLSPPPPAAAWGVFPAKGDDEWCVVTVRDDADWAALAPIIDMDDPALATRDARMEMRAAIDMALSAWLATRSPAEAAAQLQGAGIPAAPMLRVSELPTFPYYQLRGFFREVHHPHLDGAFFLENDPVHSRNLPAPPYRPAPLIGEHSMRIAHDLLGLNAARIAGLLESGVLQAPKEAVS
jgi:crotonobetainyl-CoA:carnitine CoA-transferase CaiB-like acyl-CoA transferase